MKPSEEISNRLPFAPTPGQQKTLQLLDAFMADQREEKNTFLLKGYAGTGKTTLLSALVNVLELFGYNFVLLAPTGRAAKVMASYSGKTASTIHRHIYMKVNDDGGGGFYRKKNTMMKTFFIVDEASMISDDADFGDRGLLTDLVDFVFEKKSNRLILIGDTAQLPPVKQLLSPALEPTVLRNRLGLKVTEAILTEVVRQQIASGILENATALRSDLEKNKNHIHFSTKGYKDFYRMTGEKLEDGLRYAYDKYGRENAVIITRSNKAAVMYNQYIRRKIEFYEEEISAGDMIMIVKNNYSVLPEDSKAAFLANGDFAEVRKVIDFEDRYGFRFAHLDLQLMDETFPERFEATIFLDTLHSNEPSLSSADYKKLYEQVFKEYEEQYTSKQMRMKALKKDEYLNALQVKFAYALTCHKSQGGQWDAVFVDQGYLTEEQVNTEYMRWLYTAITRASKELFMVNFNPRFYGEIE